MKKILILITGLLAVAMISFARAEASLDEGEIKISASITFTNYTGPVTHSYRLADIFGIGITLYSNRQNGKGNVSTYADGLYTLTRILSTNSRKLSADIFSIGEKAEVNHIMTLKRMIAGYIGNAFHFDRDKALLIASYIAYYNAYNRSNKDLLTNRYAPEVGTAVSIEKLGLSANYKNWPGRSELLIPITASQFLGKKVGASELYKTVDETLRQQTNKSIEERKEMLDLRKQQLEENKNVLNDKIVENKADLDHVTADIKDLNKQEPSVKRDVQLSNASQLKDSLQTQKTNLSTERDKILEEKKDIQQDEKKLAQDTKEVNYSGQETALSVYYLKLLDASKNSKELDIIDRTKLSVSRSKGGIAGKNFVLGKNLLISISLNPATSKYVLTSYTGDTLDIAAQGKENVHPESEVVMDGSWVYAVTEKSGQFFLGKFNADKLDLQAISDITVSPSASIVVTQDSIFVTSLSGKELSPKIVVLNKDDLKTVKVLD